MNSVVGEFWSSIFFGFGAQIFGFLALVTAGTQASLCVAVARYSPRHRCSAKGAANKQNPHPLARSGGGFWAECGG